MFDKSVMGVYKQEKDSTLVGHVPMECLTLVGNFDKETLTKEKIDGCGDW